MPGENEIKFVLFFDLDEDTLEDAGWRFKSIPRQGYIPAGASIHKDEDQHVFRYELFIPGTAQNIVLEQTISKQDYDDLAIKANNGVLPKQGRVREYGDKFMFTYKQWADAKNRDTEIEMKISEHDFENLFALNQGHLKKHRYYDAANDASDHDWSVDFLLDDNTCPYIVLAEVEMPEGMEDPDYIPDLIKPYIAYRVPKGDKSFSNKALTDQDHARKILEQIGVLPSQVPQHEI